VDQFIPFSYRSYRPGKPTARVLVNLQMFKSMIKCDLNEFGRFQLPRQSLRGRENVRAPRGVQRSNGPNRDDRRERFCDSPQFSRDSFRALDWVHSIRFLTAQMFFALMVVSGEADCLTAHKSLTDSTYGFTDCLFADLTEVGRGGAMETRNDVGSGVKLTVTGSTFYRCEDQAGGL
jgi:hypothetical protein